MSDPRIKAPSPVPAALLQWYIEAGLDETIGEVASNRLASLASESTSQNPRPRPPPLHPRDADIRARATGRTLPEPAQFSVPASDLTSAHFAMACNTLSELKTALETYEGCALKRTCQRTVFADGNPEARVMLVGEAPGGEEDRLGLPFVGASGKLLDRMLQSIGLDRQIVYITNVVPWRPPGNRKPEPAEVELCLPFIVRHIELIDPLVLVVLGGAAASALLARPESITRLRGRWHDFASAGLARPIPAMPTFHPAYLLRTPLQKREAWRDLRAVSKRLKAAQ